MESSSTRRYNTFENSQSDSFDHRTSAVSLLYALDTEWWWHTAILYVSDTRNKLRLW